MIRGRVTNLNISQGEYARTGQQVFALVGLNGTSSPISRPTSATSGRACPWTSFCSYPGRRFSGTVEGIGWAVHSSDDPDVGVLPNVKPSLNWVRLAQRVPVRIRLEPPDEEQPYRMGMTAVVTLLEPGDSAAPPKPGPRP